MSKFSRRAFLGGSAALAGGLAVADHLRFFEPVRDDLVKLGGVPDRQGDRVPDGPLQQL